MDNWFTVGQIDKDTFIISEYRHWEETHCYLLNGSDKSLLIDTGLGICNIYDEAIKLTNNPIIAAATHIHWDHTGGHKYFPEFYAHGEELDWLNGGFPLSLETVKKMVAERCDLPDNFDVSTYSMFQGTPSRVLKDGDTIKNRLCCPEDSSPLITILEKKLKSYKLAVTCKACSRIYKKLNG